MIHVPNLRVRLLLGACVVELVATATSAGDPARIVKLGELAKQIVESSGLAACRSRRQTFWTHNDSGHPAQLFLIDGQGREISRLHVRGVTAVDWEDVSSFRYQQQNYILVGDVGDNGRRRKQVRLLLIREPQLSGKLSTEGTIDVHRVINFRYASGPCDCEAVGVDPTTGRVLLVEKAVRGRVFSLQLFPRDQRPQVARQVARLNTPFATAMDIAPDGTRAVVLTYLGAVEYRRQRRESWAQAFSRSPRRLKMPVRRQGEAICYGLGGKALYLTSEGVSEPFWKVQPGK